MAEEKGTEIAMPYSLNEKNKEIDGEKGDYVEVGNKLLEILRDLGTKTITVLLFLNGGAAIACMGFLSSLITKTETIAITPFGWPLAFFAVGSLLAVVMSGKAYLSQAEYCDNCNLNIGILNAQKRRNRTLDELFHYAGQESRNLRNDNRKLVQGRINELHREQLSINNGLEKLQGQEMQSNSLGYKYKQQCIKLFWYSCGAFALGVISMWYQISCL